MARQTRICLGVSMVLVAVLVLLGTLSSEVPVDVHRPPATPPPPHTPPPPSTSISTTTPAPPRHDQSKAACLSDGPCHITARGIDFSIDFQSTRSQCFPELQQGMHVKSVDQIHHGIYKVTLPSGFKFAFKTECRPAAKWHGQQAWTEVAAYHFSGAAFGDERSVPCAMGLVLTLTDQQMGSLHRDRCGVTDAKGSKVVGTAMAWTSHRDDALSALSGSNKLFAPRKKLKGRQAETAGMISDVLVFDYLLLNPDRESKNWFFDQRNRLITMDNGWAFVGEDYMGSVCTDWRRYLACPPLLVQLGQYKGEAARSCGGGAQQFCVFRRKTVERLRGFAEAWAKGLDGAWKRGLRDDPVVSHLLQTYNTWDSRAPGHKPPKGAQLQYSVALARFFNKCPQAPKGGKGAEAVPPERLLDWLAMGISNRLRVLQDHIDGCVAKHGEDLVLQGDRPA